MYLSFLKLTSQDISLISLSFPKCCLWILKFARSFCMNDWDVYMHSLFPGINQKRLKIYIFIQVDFKKFQQKAISPYSYL